MTELRGRLKLEEQELLILRVDRRLSWRELADFFDENPTELERKLGNIQNKLYAMAAEEGWHPDDTEALPGADAEVTVPRSREVYRPRDGEHDDKSFQDDITTFLSKLYDLSGP